MQKWYVFWVDYDGTYSEEFEKEEDAEKLVAKVLAKEDGGRIHGTSLTAVIKGTKVEYDIINRVSTIKFK